MIRSMCRPCSPIPPTGPRSPEAWGSLRRARALSSEVPSGRVWLAGARAAAARRRGRPRAPRSEGSGRPRAGDAGRRPSRRRRATGGRPRWCRGRRWPPRSATWPRPDRPAAAPPQHRGHDRHQAQGQRGQAAAGIAPVQPHAAGAAGAGHLPPGLARRVGIERKVRTGGGRSSGVMGTTRRRGRSGRGLGRGRGMQKRRRGDAPCSRIVRGPGSRCQQRAGPRPRGRAPVPWALRCVRRGGCGDRSPHSQSGEIASNASSAAVTRRASSSTRGSSLATQYCAACSLPR